MLEGVDCERWQAEGGERLSRWRRQQRRRALAGKAAAAQSDRVVRLGVRILRLYEMGKLPGWWLWAEFNAERAGGLRSSKANRMRQKRSRGFDAFFSKQVERAKRVAWDREVERAERACR